MSELSMTVYRKLTVLAGLLSRPGTPGPHQSGRGQGRVLALLKLQPEIATSELSYLLGIRQQSLNELLKRLEGNGLIERHPSEKDRRVMLVSLTERGREAEPEQDPRAELLSCLSEDELRVFSAMLDRVLAALEAAQPAREEDARMWEHMGDERFDALWAASGRPRPPRPGCMPGGPMHGGPGRGRPPMPMGHPPLPGDMERRHGPMGRPPMPPWMEEEAECPPMPGDMERRHGPMGRPPMPPWPGEEADRPPLPGDMGFRHGPSGRPPMPPILDEQEEAFDPSRDRRGAHGCPPAPRGREPMEDAEE